MFPRVSREDIRVVLRDSGTVLAYSSAVYLVPIAVGLLYGEPWENLAEFLAAGLVSLFAGFILKNLAAAERGTEIKHALITSALVWLVFTLIAALPVARIMGMPLLDAYFEVMSALTTTGLSIMGIQIDSAPNSVIFWRSFLGWIGGVGIIVLALGGLFASHTRASRLARAEGREERLRPLLRQSVKGIWAIYAGMTLVGVLLLFFSGMDLFDSVNYSMSAISTNGMKTDSQGLTGPTHGLDATSVPNYWIDASLILLMVLGAVSFSVHYLFFKRNDWRAYINDAETKALLVLGLVGALFTANKLGLDSALFHSFSAITVGGFEGTSPFLIGQWPSFVLLLFTGLMIIGGSSGSTAGGIKLQRFLLMIKAAYWKVKEAVLPERAVFPRKFEGREVDDHELGSVAFFVLLYVGFIGLGTLVLTFTGHPTDVALFEVASAQTNAGISTGISLPTLDPVSKVMLILNMWIGRLEIFPVFAFLGFAFSFTRGLRG